MATSTASAGAPTPTAPMVPPTPTTLLKSAPPAMLVESTALSVAGTLSSAPLATSSRSWLARSRESAVAFDGWTVNRGLWWTRGESYLL